MLGRSILMPVVLYLYDVISMRPKERVETRWGIEDALAACDSEKAIVFAPGFATGAIANPIIHTSLPTPVPL